MINNIFNSDVAPIFFGSVSALALCDDGTMVFEKVLNAIAPIIEDAVGDAMKASQKRMEKYTATYSNTDKGLAPGQQA